MSWHRYYLRLGSSVFLHGDVADKTMNAQRLAEAREEWLDGRRRGPFLSALYDVVVMTRLHKPVPHLVYAKRIVVRRILKYLESIGQGPRRRGAQRLLRPYAPQIVELPLPRLDVPQRRRPDQGREVPHHRGKAIIRPFFELLTQGETGIGLAMQPYSLSGANQATASLGLTVLRCAIQLY